jgi:molybdopterin/thiamine biosynthesis adenylyltransferase
VSDPLIILPGYYAEKMDASPQKSGYIEVKQDVFEALFVIDGFTLGRDQGSRRGGSDWAKGHYLSYASSDPRGVWYEVDEALHFVGIQGRAKSASLPLDSFKYATDAAWLGLNRDAGALAVTYARLDDGTIDWRAWLLYEQRNVAQMTPIAVIDEQQPLLAPLLGHWPVEELAGAHVVVIGAGSIGSAADDALAAYGVGHLSLVDPDRLLDYNFARHRAHPRELGRHKVNAERDRLTGRDPGLRVNALPMDVVYDADVMRPLFATADAVVVAADGIDARRAANHLARRAGKPAIFACVLEDGAYGEIIRTRPGQGCLLCARAELFDQDGMAPVTTLDRGYGTGTRHLPMTAVGGDLGLIGQLAAKIAVSTILEPTGHRDQRLPGDQIIVPLRPKPGLAAPFDLDAALDVRWRELPGPRAKCPTCGTGAA